MAEPSFDDRSDFENADRGFIARLEPGIVKADDGRVVWDIDAYAFLETECPPTVNPSLWRQAQLCARQGLFEVTDGIFQVRGLDLSNMTLVEGTEGVIVIDPLISAECARAAISLYREHRGDRPVTAVIYTHSHADHFGGVLGVIDRDAPVPILAPQDFMEHAVSENVYAGNAMSRRAFFMYGVPLPKGPTGQVSTGLGIATSTGSIGLVAPTVDITHTGQEETLDGVRIVFQLTPGTEAPAEMNFLFPKQHALCVAENATHNLHNLLTLRGALVRDPRIWARYLDEAVALYGDDTDVAFASHHWPTWGRANVVNFLSQQRDLYQYLHDQTLRLTNAGYTGVEVAEMIELPPELEAVWHTHGYYGSVSHNVKAIYQRYMGWFDGNPSSLWEHTPEASASRYVESMGGIDAVVARAKAYLDDGDARFAAQLLRHAVFSDVTHEEAKSLLATTWDQLGRGAENATWRNFYLVGSLELREGVQPIALSTLSPDVIVALTVEQVFDSLAVRVNGPKAWSERITIDWTFTDLDERYRLTLSNGALSHSSHIGTAAPDLSVTLNKGQLLTMLAGKGMEGVEHTGDPGVLVRLAGLLDEPDPNFAIVTP